MTPWTAFNYQGEYVFDAARVKNIGYNSTLVTWSRYRTTKQYWLLGHSFMAGRSRRRPS